MSTVGKRPAPVLPAVPVSRFTVKSEDLVPEPGRNPEDGDWEAFGSAGSTGFANDAGFRSASRASSMAPKGVAANARASRLVCWVNLVHLDNSIFFQPLASYKSTSSTSIGRRDGDARTRPAMSLRNHGSFRGLRLAGQAQCSARRTPRAAPQTCLDGGYTAYEGSPNVRIRSTAAHHDPNNGTQRMKKAS